MKLSRQSMENVLRSMAVIEKLSDEEKRDAREKFMRRLEMSIERLPDPEPDPEPLTLEERVADNTRRIELLEAR